MIRQKQSKRGRLLFLPCLLLTLLLAAGLFPTLVAAAAASDEAENLCMNNLQMGIRGAAIATVIGYCSAIVYAVWFYVIAGKSSYKLELAKPDMREIGQICFNGSSDMVSNLAQGVTVLFMNHLAYFTV